LATKLAYIPESFYPATISGKAPAQDSTARVWAPGLGAAVAPSHPSTRGSVAAGRPSHRHDRRSAFGHFSSRRVSYLV